MLMKLLSLPLLFGCFLWATGPASAQAENPAAAEAKTEPTLDEVTRYANQLRTRIDSRQDRATAMVNDLVALDKSIQSNVDGILSTLKGMTDSNDSRTRVARTKRDVMERLGKAAEAYTRLRAELEEQLRRDGNAYRREELFRERGIFDDRIDRMIQGAVGVALSMDTHEEHDKYIVEAGDSGWGWDTVYRDNPAYEQNRRAARRTDAAVRDLGAGLEKAMQRLDLKIRETQQALLAPGTDAAKKAALETELKRLQSLRAQRADQEAALYTYNNTPATTPVALDEALRSEKWIESVAQETRRDFNQMIARYRELRVERDAIAELRGRLDQAEAWLKSHAPAP